MSRGLGDVYKRQVLDDDGKTAALFAEKEDSSSAVVQEAASVFESVSAAAEESAAAVEQEMDSDSHAMAALSRAGIDIQQGISYCGDKEGFREITAMYYKEGTKRRVRLLRLFEEKDWKNYVIAVHALKSNSKGIGANEVSELALGLEMAGKENRIEYIICLLYTSDAADDR